MVQGLTKAGGRVALMLALACVLIAPVARAATAPRSATYDNTAQILKTFPNVARATPLGVTLHLKTGHWVDVNGNLFGKAPPVVCWYAPALNVAGVCMNGPGVTVTIMVDLRNGKQLSAPGRASLTPDPTLIAVGPDDPRKVPADSLTLMRVAPTELLEEGGEEFSGDYGPGAWVDDKCYRLTAYGPGPGGWLEKADKDWREVPATKSTFCQKRHGG